MVALRERAAALSFSEPELVAVAPVLALASEDPEQRARMIEEAYAREPEPPPAITAALATVLGEPGALAVSRGRARKLGAAAPVIATAVAPVAPAGVPSPPAVSRSAESTGIRGPAGSPPAASRPAASDPGGAKAHSIAGQGALRRGDLDAAAAAFHRALAADRNDVASLAGLGEVSFQRRAYENAAKFLERAAALAPRNAEIHIDLGDVYFKVLRYADARTQYDEAQALGHAGAARRIARLDRRLGAEP
jgi:tetratricopeptide (TPR) repeat protein